MTSNQPRQGGHAGPAARSYRDRGVSPALPCCEAGEKQSSAAECLWWQQTRKELELLVVGRNPFGTAISAGSQPDPLQQEGEGVTLMQQYTSFPSWLLKHTYAPAKYRACRQLEGKEQTCEGLAQAVSVHG